MQPSAPAVAPDGSLANCDGAALDPGPLYSRRLNRTEYDNTVRDLLGVNLRLGAAFPGEELAHNFDNNAVALSSSPLLVEEYARAAEAIAGSAELDWAALVPCDVSGGEGCAGSFIAEFGLRAFRRPLEAAEVERYLGVFRAGSTSGFEAGVRLVVNALLQSAPFLYRIEPMRAELGAATVRATSHEMASRLSYLLWKTMPDAQLFDAASAELLQTPEQVEVQARRMVADPRAKEMVADFHGQWLALRELDRLEKSPELFPEYNESIARDMGTEAALFIEDVLYNDGDASHLFDADYTFVNGNLATFYGMSGVTGDEFRKVTRPNEQRAGVLTLGGVLSILAKPNQTNPIIRGKHVRVQVLCNEMPDPPAGINIQVPELDPSLTTRERFRQHSEDAACAGCHALMDPLGFAFESFDAVGRFRETENGANIDLSGEVVGTDVVGAFNGVEELGQKIAQSADVKACFVKNWFRYAYGRAEGDGAADECILERLSSAFAASNQNVTELIVALTLSDAFLSRRTGDAP